MAAPPAVTLVVRKYPKKDAPGDCPFCHRIMLTLASKGIPFTTEHIDMSETAPRPQWLLDASDGKVPVLKVPSDGNLLLPDSDKIAVYLETKYPSPSMKSSVPESITKILATVYSSFRAYLRSTPADADATREALLADLKGVNAYLATPGNGPLFGGKTLNDLDAAFAPKLYHLSVGLAHYKAFEIPLEMSGLWRYMAYVQALSAWQDVDYGSKIILEGLKKYFV